MAEELNIEWVWQWTLGSPDYILVNANWYNSRGDTLGAGTSSSMSIERLPDGSKDSLAALARWAKVGLETENPSLTIKLPDGTVVNGSIEVQYIRYYAYSDKFMVDSHTVFSPQVDRGGPSHEWTLTDLPSDLQEVVKALDVPIHDFVLEETLRKFEGASVVSQIPSSLRWVFVTYHSNDKEFAEKLARRLERTGVFHAFFFPWQIGWAGSIRSTIDAGLAKCNAGIVVFSPEFLGQGWRDYEYNGLINKKVNEGSKVGYALLRGDLKNVPYALQDYFYADFRNPQYFEQEFLKIYRGLLGRPLEDRPKS